jgi:peptidyl-tRNA hydrolase
MKEKWTKEKCHKVALLCKSRTELVIKYPHAYDSAIRHKWIDEICSHMKKYDNNPRGYWSKEKCHKIALLYNTKKEFENMNRAAYSAAIRHKWIDEICSHMKKYDNNPRGYWMNKEKCHEVALLCKTKKEFREKYGSAIYQSRKNGWMDEICSHMIDLR